MHSQSVIHVDLKLENVLMLSPDRSDEYLTPKLCDFGLSHILQPQYGNKAFMEVLCGTHGYTAPE